MGSEVSGQVIEIQHKKGILIGLEGGVQGFIKISDVSNDHVTDMAHYVQMGEQVEAKVTALDARSQQLMLSMKALEQHHGSGDKQAQPKGATLGDVMKEQMKNRSDD